MPSARNEMQEPEFWTNWRTSLAIRLAADRHEGPVRVRDGWRTIRRRIKHRLLERHALYQPRFFCLNSGCCGSTYLVRLLADNKWPCVWHEKPPDFNELGISHYDSPLPESRLASLLRYTRWDVFLEANNRLFSLAIPLHRAFPGARFIHLHRDGRQAVRSAMSRPDVEEYLATNVRFRGSLAGRTGQRPFERFCHYWNNINRRILDDLAALEPHVGASLSLRFSDLISGRVEALAHFANRAIPLAQREAVNRSPVARTGQFPEYTQWTERDRRSFDTICGETMQRLGY
jgi:hypothetical protein